MTAVDIRERLHVQTPEEAVPYINLLVYGEPGAGKTFLAATAQDHEETSPILFLDIEGGTTTIRHRKDVDVITVRTMREIEEIHNELKKAKDAYYKTVIIDSLTELQKLDMMTVMRGFKDSANKPDNVDVFVPNQRAWGKSNERIRMIVRYYKDLPMHTIVTALQADRTDETTNVTGLFPDLPGKLRSQVAGFFDIVGLLRVVEIQDGDEKIMQRVLQTAKTRTVSAKDRTDSLGGLLENPTIPLIWEAIYNSDDGGSK